MSGTGPRSSSYSAHSGNNDMKIFNNKPALIFELVSFLIAFVISLLIAFNTFDIQPFQRGFFCNDESLMYPYKDDTISTMQAAAIAVLIFPIVALIVEPLYILTRMRNTGIETKAVLKTVGKSFYSLVMMYLLGGALTQLFVATTKLTVGRLRPNFFAWCIPDYNITDCSVGGGYVQDFICTNNDTHAVEDVRQSFPSGHSAGAAYAFVYVAIYLDIRLRQQLKWKLYFRVIAPTVQTLLVIAGTYICVSRIQDNKHHPTDVIGGAVIGLIACLSTSLIWSKASLTDSENNLPTERPMTQNGKETFVNMRQGGGSQLPIMPSTSVNTVLGQDNYGVDPNSHL